MTLMEKLYDLQHEFSVFLRQVWQDLEDHHIKPLYQQWHKATRKIYLEYDLPRERKATMEYYQKMLQDIAPHHPNDWRAGDVCFLDQYQNDPELYQKLLQIRKDYFNNRI